MRKRGRPASPITRIDVKLRLETSLAATLDLICLDPLRNRVENGARSTHIEAALREYFARHFPKLAPPTPEPFDKLPGTP